MFSHVALRNLYSAGNIDAPVIGGTVTAAVVVGPDVVGPVVVEPDVVGPDILGPAEALAECLVETIVIVCRNSSVYNCKRERVKQKRSYV